ncbi:sulfotransferase ssu-1-like [Haemaphysalis longicornis]
MNTTRFPAYQVIDGLKFAKMYVPENVRKARSYVPRDEDLVMVSYVKCGNNWLEQILQLILHRGESAANYMEFHKWTLYPELTGMHYLNKAQPPRFLKTHFPYEHQLKNPKAKFIYLTRNPLDTCVSFYYYVRGAPMYDFEDGSFDDFVQAFVMGEVERGDYCDHLLSWYSHRTKPNVFLVTYEQLKEDFRNTVLSIAGFMGAEYRSMLEEDDTVYRNLVEKSSVSFMKKLCRVDRPVLEKQAGEDQFFLDAMNRLYRPVHREDVEVKDSAVVRKGVVGEWKAHFSQHHLDLVSDWIDRKRAAGVIREIWGDLDLGGIV